MKNIVDILQHYKPLTTLQKANQIVKETYMAVTHYSDGSHYGALTDLTSIAALTHIQRKMLQDEKGRWILTNKPRITNETFLQLQNCEEGTFGKSYHQFMAKYEFKPSERPIARYIPDIQLAYIAQRYKQIHDFLHVLLLDQVNVHNELLIKWFEMIQLGFPSATLAVMSSPLLSNNMDLEQIAAICRKANKHKFIMNVYFQDHFNTNLEQFRKQLIQ